MRTLILFPKVVASGQNAAPLSHLVNPDGFLVLDGGTEGIRSLTFPEDGTPGTLSLIFSAPEWPFVLKIPRNSHLIGCQPIDSDRDIAPGYQLAHEHREILGPRIPDTLVWRGLKILKVQWHDLQGIHQVLSGSSRSVIDQGAYLEIQFAILQQKKLPLVVLIRQIRDEMRSGAITADEARRRGRLLIDGVFLALDAILAVKLFMRDLILRNVAQMDSSFPPYFLGFMDLDEVISLESAVVRELVAANVVPATSRVAQKPFGPRPTVIFPAMYANAQERYFGEIDPALDAEYQARCGAFFTIDRFIECGAGRG